MSAAPPVDAFVGLGANAGDRRAALEGAVVSLRGLGDVVAASSVYETEAHVLPGAPPQPDHLNAVVHLRTTRTAAELLAALHAIERAAGRDPDAPRWSPRPLDLDLLLYGDVVTESEALHLPHPRIATRRFVLAPLAELAPGRVIPATGQTVAELLAETTDTAAVRQVAWRVAE